MGFQLQVPIIGVRYYRLLNESFSNSNMLDLEGLESSGKRMFKNDIVYVYQMLLMLLEIRNPLNEELLML